jgi:hypothetical protein
MYADNRSHPTIHVSCKNNEQNPSVTHQQTTYPVVTRQQYSYPAVNQFNTSPTRPPRASRAFIVVIKKRQCYFLISFKSLREKIKDSRRSFERSICFHCQACMFNYLLAITSY